MMNGKTICLMISGAIAAEVGWLLLSQPWTAFLADPAFSATPIRWLLYLALPLPIGAASAFLYPHWERVLRMRSELLKSMLYGALVAFVLVLGCAVFMVAPFGYGLRVFSDIGAIFVPAVGAIAGLCFHFLKVTRSTRLPNGPGTPSPAL